MNNSINFKNLNNILLYKKALDKFISINKINISNFNIYKDQFTLQNKKTNN